MFLLAFLKSVLLKRTISYIERSCCTVSFSFLGKPNVKRHLRLWQRKCLTKSKQTYFFMEDKLHMAINNRLWQAFERVHDKNHEKYHCLFDENIKFCFQSTSIFLFRGFHFCYRLHCKVLAQNHFSILESNSKKPIHYRADVSLDFSVYHESATKSEVPYLSLQYFFKYTKLPNWLQKSTSTEQICCNL